jgi:hypothetical protein
VPLINNNKSRRKSFFPFGGSDSLLNYLSQIKLQDVSDPQQGFQTWRPQVPLDKADHGAGQAGSFGNNGHGEMAFLTFFSQNTGNVGADQVYLAG